MKFEIISSIYQKYFSISRGGAKDVFDAGFGIVLNQAILLAISPVLSRIYTPTDFGIFAVFFAFVSILSIAITGRYELAILVPSKHKQANQIVMAALSICLLITLLTGFLLTYFNRQLFEWLNIAQISGLVPLISASLLLAGCISILNYWLIRQKCFRPISIGRIVQGLVLAVTSIGLGLAGYGAQGMIGGYIAGQLIRLSHMGYTALNLSDCLKLFVPGTATLVQLKKYREFPIYNTPAALLNAAKIQIPTFMMSANYTTTQVGHYDMTNRALGTPSSFVGLAIGDVFHQRLATRRHQGQSLYPLTIKLALYLLVIGIFPVAIVVMFGPTIFEIAFGGQWRQTGEFVQILAPAFLVRFIASPLGRVYIINDRVKLNSLWQVTSFVTMALTVYAAAGLNIHSFLIFVSLHEIVSYTVYLLGAIYASNR